MTATNKKPKLVLHVGLQKTGTSSIQLHLNRLTKKLAKHGYYYPVLPASSGVVWNSAFRHGSIAGTVGDYNTTFERLSPEQEEVFWDQLYENDLTPILSAEDFSRILDLTKLKNRLERFETTVLLYVRRQDLFSESLYNQNNKLLLQQCSNLLIRDDLLTEKALFQFLSVSRYIPLLNFKRLTDSFVNLNSDTKLIVRTFERANFVQGNVCVDFFDQLGIRLTPSELQSDSFNGSVANRYFQEILTVNEEFGFDAARSKVSELSKRLAAGEDLSGDYKIIPGPTRQAMLNQYKTINEYVEGKYGIEINQLPEARTMKSSPKNGRNPAGVSYKEALTTMRGNLYAHWSRAWKDRATQDAHPEDAVSRLGNGYATVYPRATFPIRSGDKVFCMGSCFAREIEDEFETNGVLPTSKTSIQTALDLGEASLDQNVKGRPNAFLTRSNSGSMLSEVNSITGHGSLESDLLYGSDESVYDAHYSPVLKKESREQSMIRRESIRRALVEAFMEADCYIFTFGLCEAFYDTTAKQYLNVTPNPRVAKDGSIDFRTINYADNVAHMREIMERVLEVKPDAKVIFTVSPVPLDATFKSEDVVIANVRAKSNLVAATHDVCDEFDQCFYFPSYEMVTLTDPVTAWRADRKHVSEAMVSHIMQQVKLNFVEKDAE